MPSTVIQPIFGGGSTPEGYSWHLSVIDAGQPRDAGSGEDLAADLQKRRISIPSPGPAPT